MTARQAAPAPGPRDAVVVAAALLALAALAWAWTARAAYLMETMDHAAMRAPTWSLRDAALLLAMWSVMMVAMMAPAVAPMTLAFATINQRRRERRAAFVATAFFVAGYLIAWLGFSALATVAQIALHAVRVLDAMMVQSSPWVAAALFLAAGLYQWTSLKERCLARCRSLDGFILAEWRDGRLGAVAMGLRHGLVCIGCCAPLMALLFAWSVMDLRWVAALTGLVLVEKLLPQPQVWRRLIGAGLVAAAAALAIRGLAA